MTTPAHTASGPTSGIALHAGDVALPVVVFAIATPSLLAAAPCVLAAVIA